MQIPRTVKVDVLQFATAAADCATADMADIQDTRVAQDTQDSHHAQAAHEAEVTHVPATPSTPSTPSTPDLADKPRPIENLIASIGTAVAPGASAEARGVGAAACRAILTALEAQVGQPLAAAPPIAPSQPSPLAGMLSQLAAMPREQLIEFFINQLRGARSPGTPIQVAAGPRFYLSPTPQVRAQGGGSWASTFRR